MSVQKLDRAQWQAFADQVTKTVTGKEAEIEVAELRLGAHIEAEWLPLLGIAYDPREDLFEIVIGAIDHLIRHPREVFFEIGPTGLESLEIVDEDGVQQIIKLRDPLMLPAPAAARGAT
jgi:hypothetical protein